MILHHRFATVSFVALLLVACSGQSGSSFFGPKGTGGAATGGGAYGGTGGAGGADVGGGRDGGASGQGASNAGGSAGVNSGGAAGEPGSGGRAGAAGSGGVAQGGSGGGSGADGGSGAGGGAGGGSGGGSTVCKLQMSLPQCTQCLAMNCGSACVTCQQEPQCIPADNCTHACGTDQTCLDGCIAKYPNGSDTATGLDYCMLTHCPLCSVL